MAIIKTQKPYELLVRWKDGVVSGAHVKFLERIEENGVVLTEKEGDAQPISIAGSVGFPLADILSTVQSDALAAIDAANMLASTSASTLLAEQNAHAETKAKLAELESMLPPKNPTTVTMKQARLALLNAGLLDTVNTAIATMPKSVQLEWEFSTTVERTNLLLNSIAVGLGLTNMQIDELFTSASTL
jgi:hypothetical protein